MKEDEAVVADWDKEYWEKIVGSCLDNSKAIYRYDESTRLDSSVVKNKVLEPIIVYTLFDIYEILGNSNVDKKFLEGLAEIKKEGLSKNNIGFIILSDKQKEFIEKYKEDVASWLPLAYKKFVLPNSRNIKGLCSASI